MNLLFTYLFGNCTCKELKEKSDIEFCVLQISVRLFFVAENFSVSFGAGA